MQLYHSSLPATGSNWSMWLLEILFTGCPTSSLRINTRDHFWSQKRATTKYMQFSLLRAKNKNKQQKHRHIRSMLHATHMQLTGARRHLGSRPGASRTDPRPEFLRQANQSCIYIYIYIHIHMYDTYIYIYIYVYIYIYIYTCIHV